MKKVLIVITTSFVQYGGLATVMLNYYRSMDKENICIDFASTNRISEELFNELIANNSSYYNLGSRKKHFIKYEYNLIKLLLEKKYDIIHVNGNSSTMAIELVPALLIGIKKRIAHVHTTKSNYPIINTLMKPLFRKTYTKSIATSREAGEWLFGHEFIVLNNAININKYGYNETVRRIIRKKYGIEDSIYIIGTVGKLNKPKNHKFLIDVFCEIIKIHEKTKLMICGGGDLEPKLREYAEQRQVSNKIIFTGMVNGSHEVLQAMDIFVFPSKFEGLGMVLIEAQASGLKCFASDVVPAEANVADLVTYISLQKSYSEWAEIISENMNSRIKRMNESACAKQKITMSGYDICEEATHLKEIYMEE